MLRYAHYAAKTEQQLCLFTNVALAHHAWRWLRVAFPAALAATLMPDHLHLIAPDRGEDGAMALRRVLNRLARRFNVPPRQWWAPVPPPEPIATRDKLRRSVRYVWLNPCRPWTPVGGTLQLETDPLAWPWSSLRDTVGGVLQPWTPAPRVARAFGWSDGGSPERRLHGYATRDEHVDEYAREFPSMPLATDVPGASLAAVVQASLSATRALPEDLRRRGRARRVLVGLAYQQGWDRPQRLADLLAVHPDSVSRMARLARADETRIAALCLDRRLRRGPEEVARQVEGHVPHWAA